MSPSPFYEDAVSAAQVERSVGRKERMDERMRQAKEWRRHEDERLRVERKRTEFRSQLIQQGLLVGVAAEKARRKRANRRAQDRAEMKGWERSRQRLLKEIADRRTEATEAAERAELEHRRIVHLMHAAPGASASHRGTKSTYNTADREVVRREPDAPRERLTDGKRHPVTVTRTSDSRGRMRP